MISSSIQKSIRSISPSKQKPPSVKVSLAEESKVKSVKSLVDDNESGEAIVVDGGLSVGISRVSKPFSIKSSLRSLSIQKVEPE